MDERRKKELILKRTEFRYGESLLHMIIRKTGRKPCECRCEKCKSQCHQPFLGTPQDILRIINAGYGDKLFLKAWYAGMVMGVCDHSIAMVQAELVDGWCTFFDKETGLCELHDKGLKPTEGRLSSHLIQIDNFDAKHSIAWNVAKEWEDTRSNPVIAEIVKYIKARREVSKSK